MEVKKKYNVGDTVWIHGVSPSNKLTKGKVIFCVDIPNYYQEHFIIEISTHIDPLLEIRTWDTISQDDIGPVGSLRTINIDNENKKIGHLGYIYSADSHYDYDDPTPDEILAALENSTANLVHKPLNLKDNSKKRKYYPRKKKQ